MKEGITFIILGATGDLTKRKLIPALYRLVKNRKLENFALVGAARDETTIKEIFAGKLIAAMRQQFGGHRVVQKK